MGMFRTGLLIASTIASLPWIASTSCQRGAVDTTKSYYEDGEAPAYQIQILNGEEKRVPWADVPEAQRFFLEYEDGRLRVRVPIVKVTTTSLDEQNRPVPPEKAFRYEYVEEGLNPAYKRRGMGGSKH